MRPPSNSKRKRGGGEGEGGEAPRGRGGKGGCVCKTSCDCRAIVCTIQTHIHRTELLPYCEDEMNGASGLCSLKIVISTHVKVDYLIHQVNVLPIQT